MLDLYLMSFWLNQTLPARIKYDVTEWMRAMTVSAQSKHADKKVHH